MSLLRLLAAGRSLIGMRETVSPYRMRTANLLPKFGSPKNPFMCAPKTEPANPEPAAATPATPAVPAAAVKPATAKTEPAKMETISLFDAKPVASPMPAKVAEAPSLTGQPVKPELVQTQPAAAAKVAPARKPLPLPLAEWVKKLNPLQYLTARAPDAKKSIRSKGARTPVQAELSLEKVKVVRNDLSDTDLAVIPAKPAAVPNAAGPMIQPMT
ncbi:MAG TPA: hypothetical protein VFC07_04525, partial [Verrucomicrobiae bacterium]|nr:hypothetical protein [Verrucomicrobiae bacterium]